MSNVIITADIHIMDYRQHNLFGDPLFRLKQFDKLADRLIEISDEQKTDALIIAGDFLHVANPRPYIVNAAFNFLEKISQKMYVYLTHGQHDYDSRTSMDGENTLLTLVNLLPNVQYLHKQSIHIGQCKFYFLGWEPDWKTHARNDSGSDVLIGHVQPENIFVGQRGLKMHGGVSIDDKLSYKVAFLGDIHYHQSRSNWVIPGTPIAHSFNDKPECGVIIFNTKTFEWKFKPTIIPGERDFLRFLITDDVVDDKYVVSKPKTTTEVLQIQGEIEKSIDTLHVITSSVQDAELNNIHEELIGSIPKDVREDVNLMFELCEIKIKDFRSIKSFDWNNIDNGVKLVSGKNGTGKSSLVSAIIFGLTGDGEARKLTRDGSKQMEVEISVQYNGLKHTIRRGWAAGGKTRYFIEGTEQVAENQNTLKKKIQENLSFLSMMDLMYHRQDRPGFLASYNYGARVELISRVLGLRIVDALFQVAQMKAVGIEQELAKIRQRLVAVTTILDQENLVDFSTLEMIDEETEKTLKDLQKRVTLAFGEERERYQKIVSHQTILVNSIERETRDITSLEKRWGAIKQKQCYTCGQAIAAKKSEELSVELTQELTERKASLEVYEKELVSLKSTKILDESAKKLQKLQNKILEISNHLGEITALKDHVQSLLRLKNSIDRAKDEMKEIQLEEEKIKKELDELLTYRKLFDKNGPVMRSLLNTVSELLSSSTLRVRAYKELVNGELRPDFGVDMLVEKKWINYDELSGGQQSVADLTILEKLIRIVGGTGFLIFDETFKFLDNENLEIAVALLKEIQCHSTFIISHAEGFPMFDTQISTSLIDGFSNYGVL